jgi:hypothetical protein
VLVLKILQSIDVGQVVAPGKAETLEVLEILESIDAGQVVGSIKA